MFCDYNCGNQASFKLKNKKNCCQIHSNKCPANKKKNSLGNQKSHASGLRKYTYNPLSNWAKGKSCLTDDRIKSNIGKTILLSSYSFTRIANLIKNSNLLEYKCKICSITDWHGKNLTLQLDHINGDRVDNRLENLRWLCPNCHSLTPTYCGKNNTGKRKYSDEDLLLAVEKSNNLHQLLVNLKLSPKGGNYSLIKKRLDKLKITKYNKDK